MYVPRNMRMLDPQILQQFMERYDFGLLLSRDLQVSHLPFVYQLASSGQDPESDLGYLVGHMARANPQWKICDGNQVSVVFNGPHAYISPTWYGQPPAVPTWNYAAVQCFGVFELCTTQETPQALAEIVQQHEPQLLQDKALMPDAYIDKLSKAIVAFRIRLTAIQGKEKLGQHKTQTEQQGVYRGLRDSEHPDATALADYMDRRSLGNGAE